MSGDQRYSASNVSWEEKKDGETRGKKREQTDSIRARTRNYSARLFSVRDPTGSQGHRIPGLPFVRVKKKREKEKREKTQQEEKNAKNGGRDANIFASRRKVHGGESVRREGQSPSATGYHIHARRRNSRWRWITWSRFKVRSPPFRVTLTRRAPLPVLLFLLLLLLHALLPLLPPRFPLVSLYICILDRCDARASRPKYPQLCDQSRVLCVYICIVVAHVKLWFTQIFHRHRRRCKNKFGDAN